MQRPPSARTQLIAAQRQLVEKAKRRISESLALPGAVEAYFDEYQRELADHRGPVERRELFEALDSAQIVYFGDYHTLRESQKEPLRILREMQKRGRSLVIATEVVHGTHQHSLDRYLAGELDEDAFLESVDYERTWGFSWKNHRLQFDFAREHGIPVFGINSDPHLRGDRLKFRDTMAAEMVAELTARFPEHLLAVLFGDLHVIPSHLPALVDRFLGRRERPAPTRVIVYQNAERVYWDLAEKGLEQTTDLVRIDDASFCVLNSTPLVKYQSYVNWELNEEELEESMGLGDAPAISSNIMTEQVLSLVHTIADFLEIPTTGLHDFSVHTSRDLDFLDKLAATGEYSDAELDEIRHQIVRDESYYIGRSHVIYLGNLSVDHAAEEATHYLNAKLSGHVESPPTVRYEFYYRIMKEAIAFLGSKVVNHKRSCYRRADFERLRDELKGRRGNEELQTNRMIAHDVLRHLDFEARWLAGEVRGYPRFRSVYERPLEVHVGVTHSLGYILGDRIYDALMVGMVRRNEVRHLFRERFAAPERPREVYFDWIDYLQRD